MIPVLRLVVVVPTVLECQGCPSNAGKTTPAKPEISSIPVAVSGTDSGVAAMNRLASSIALSSGSKNVSGYVM
jgi:hypothetical protein